MALEPSWILESLLARKTGNRFFTFRMLCNTAIESVQNTEVHFLRFNSRFANRFSFTTRTAAVNSSLGMDIDLRGATLAFPIKKAQKILPSLFFTRKYVTALYAALYAALEVFGKVCSSELKTHPKSKSFRAQGIASSSK